MAIGFAGTVDQFFNLARKSTIGPAISKNREQTGGHKLTPHEELIWTEDAPAIERLLLSANIPFNRTYLLLEYDIPGHLGRCDGIIIGSDEKGVCNALVFEMKRWQTYNPITNTEYVNVGGRIHLSPSQQALQYKERARLFHELGNDYRWYGAVFLTELTPAQAKKYDHSDVKCITWGIKDACKQYSDYLYKLFSGGSDLGIFNKFRDGHYKQSCEFASNLLRRLPYLTSGIQNALGGLPIDLTPAQQEIVGQIESAIREFKGHTLILISGDPGCGKTIVGLHSMINQLSLDRDSRVVLALRNNRLCQVVRRAIDQAAGAGQGGALVQYVKGGGPNAGIYPKVKRLLSESPSRLPIYDLIVVDEAHRIPHRNPNGNLQDLSQIESLFHAGRVVVCLFDEGQVLNDDDAGSRNTLKQTWQRLFPNDPIFELSMNEQHRLPPDQHRWLTEFFQGNIVHSPQCYELELFDHPSEVIDFLRKKSRTHDCGLLASYTYSDGRNGNTLRILDPPVHWLMQPSEYDIWWRNRNIRHQFQTCASVYGCQGFELDYAGLFWGRDLRVLCQGDRINFVLCNPHDITDIIGRAYGPALRTIANHVQENHDEILMEIVIRRLINRYRILMSRGRKGLAIYCEDPTTLSSLKACLKRSR